MGYLLLILTLLLFFMILPFGILVAIGKTFYHSHFDRGLKYSSDRMHSLSFAFDCFVNAAFPELWTLLWSTKDSIHHFGKQGEPISYVLGKLQLESMVNGKIIKGKSLSCDGIDMVNTLKLLTGKEHCLTTVTEIESTNK
jgi:hypothetical protein